MIVTEFDGIASGISQARTAAGRAGSGSSPAPGRTRVARGRGRFTIVVDAVGNRSIGTEAGRIRLR